MWPKIKRTLQAAAALVIAGTALTLALRQAGQAEGVTCEQWGRAVDGLNNIDQHVIFWLAVSSGTTPPGAFADRIIGNCASGVCSASPGGQCDYAATYTYELTGAVSGHRVFRVKAHPYFAGALKAWAEGTAGVTWLGTMGEAFTKCKTVFTAAKCINLLSQGQQCWMQADGTLCRFGRTYRVNGPGRVTDGACSPATGSRPYPCDSGKPDEDSNLLLSNMNTELPGE